MSLAPLTTLAATSATGGINPFAVGGTIFVFLLILMAGLLFFGAGRDHS
ncbi:MAG: hypothetical protein ACXVXC_06405 [Nocardioidaceae bacterium]